MRSFSRRSLLVALGLVAFAGGCSGDDAPKGGAGGATTTPARAEPGTPTTAPGPYAFTLKASAVHPMALTAPDFPADVVAAVQASLDTWLGNAVVGPLRAGQPSTGLDAVFTEPALGRISVAGAERSAMLEEAGPLTGKVHQDRANANLTLVTAPGGEPVLVTAQIDLSHAVTSGDGFVDVVRAGELVLVPDRGNWRIDAFDVIVSRNTRAK